jgi:hypothetical protein
LEKLELTNSEIVHLEANAFAAQSLTDLRLDGLKCEVISAHVFGCSRSLRRLELTNSCVLREIRRDALAGLTSLTYLSLLGSECLNTVQNGAFDERLTALQRLSLTSDKLSAFPSDLLQQFKLSNIIVRPYSFF